MFMVSDENFSWYLDENIRTYITNPPRDLKEDEDFIESNKMHGEVVNHIHIDILYIQINCTWFNPELCIAGINGFVFGNLPGLSMCQGNKIHWHLIGLGNEVTCDYYNY